MVIYFSCLDKIKMQGEEIFEKCDVRNIFTTNYKQ